MMYDSWNSAYSSLPWSSSPSIHIRVCTLGGFPPVLLSFKQTARHLVYFESRSRPSTQCIGLMKAVHWTISRSWKTTQKTRSIFFLQLLHTAIVLEISNRILRCHQSPCRIQSFYTQKNTFISVAARKDEDPLDTNFSWYVGSLAPSKMWLLGLAYNNLHTRTFSRSSKACKARLA